MLKLILYLTCTSICIRADLLIPFIDDNDLSLNSMHILNGIELQDTLAIAGSTTDDAGEFYFILYELIDLDYV